MKTLKQSIDALALAIGVDLADANRHDSTAEDLDFVVSRFEAVAASLFAALELEAGVKPRTLADAVEWAGANSGGYKGLRDDDKSIRTTLGAHDGETTEDAARRVMKWSDDLYDVLRPQGTESTLAAAGRLVNEAKTQRHRIGQICSWLGITDPANIQGAIESALLASLHGRQAAAVFLGEGESMDLLGDRMRATKETAARIGDIEDLAGRGVVGTGLKRAAAVARANADAIAALRSGPETFVTRVEALLDDEAALAEIRANLVDADGDYILGAETCSDAVVALVMLHGRVCGLVDVDPATDRGEAERRLVGLADAGERSLAHETRELVDVVRNLVTMDPLIQVEGVVAGCRDTDKGFELEFRVGHHKWLLSTEGRAAIQRVLRHLGETVSLRVHAHQVEK